MSHDNRESRLTSLDSFAGVLHRLGRSLSTLVGLVVGVLEGGVFGRDDVVGVVFGGDDVVGGVFGGEDVVGVEEWRITVFCRSWRRGHELETRRQICRFRCRQRKRRRRSIFTACVEEVTRVVVGGGGRVGHAPRRRRNTRVGHGRGGAGHAHRGTAGHASRCGAEKTGAGSALEAGVVVGGQRGCHSNRGVFCVQ